jgi:hypothetical protein
MIKKKMPLCCIKMSLDSSGRKVTDYGSDYRGSIPGRGREFHLHTTPRLALQTTQSASYPTDAARGWRWPTIRLHQVPGLKMGGALFPSPIHHGVVFHTGTIFPLCGIQTEKRSQSTIKIYARGYLKELVSFGVPKAIKMSMLIFWVVTPCGLVGTYLLHPQA